MAGFRSLTIGLTLVAPSTIRILHMTYESSEGSASDPQACWRGSASLTVLARLDRVRNGHKTIMPQVEPPNLRIDGAIKRGKQSRDRRWPPGRPSEVCQLHDHPDEPVFRQRAGTPRAIRSR